MPDSDQRTPSHVAQQSCESVNPLHALAPAQAVHPPVGEPEHAVQVAYERARASAGNRCREFVGGSSTVPSWFPQVDDLVLGMTQAVRTAHSDLTVHSMARPDEVILSHHNFRSLPFEDEQTADVDGLLVGNACRNGGGLSLLHADRHLPGLAPLTDDLSTTFASPATTTAVIGTARASTIRCGNLAVVFALGGEVLVRSVDRTETHTIVAGESAPFEQFGDLEVSSGAIAVVIAVNRMTKRDLRLVASGFSTGSPRLRGDVPYDIYQPAFAYGIDDPVDPVTFMNDEARLVFGSDTGISPLAWWRASLRPSKGCADVVTLGGEVEDWPAVRMRGSLIGGIGVISADSPIRTLTFAGEVVGVHEHVFDLLEQVASGSRFSPDDHGTSCPQHDPYCGRRAARTLVELGVVHLA